MITLVLPYPISANRYWRTYMPRGFASPVTTLSNEAKEYKATVQKIVRNAGVGKMIAGRVEIGIQLYPHRPQDWQKRMQRHGAAWDDDVRCIDLDNANKVLLDALKGIAIEDDKWVRRIVAERMEPDGEARVVVTITKIEAEQPQVALFESEVA